MKLFSICVSFKGRHYFTTDHISNPSPLRQTNEETAESLFNHLCKAFPAEEGYTIDLSYKVTVGYSSKTREAK